MIPLPSDPTALLQLIAYMALASIVMDFLIFLLIARIAIKAGMSKQDIINTIWSVGSIFLSLLRFLNDKGLITNDEYLRLSALFVLILKRPDLSEKLMLYILQTPNLIRTKQ